MSDEFVTLATYRSAPKADLARAFLEQAGIPAFVADANAVTTDWFLGNALGYVKLEVPAEHAEAALNIFRDHPQLVDRGRPPADPDDGIVKCLACDTVLPDDVDRCPACGWSYDDDPGDE